MVIVAIGSGKDKTKRGEEQ